MVTATYLSQHQSWVELSSSSGEWQVEPVSSLSTPPGDEAITFPEHQHSPHHSPSMHHVSIYLHHIMALLHFPALKCAIKYL